MKERICKNCIEWERIKKGSHFGRCKDGRAFCNAMCILDKHGNVNTDEYDLREKIFLRSCYSCDGFRES